MPTARSSAKSMKISTAITMPPIVIPLPMLCVLKGAISATSPLPCNRCRSCIRGVAFAPPAGMERVGIGPKTVTQVTCSRRSRQLLLTLHGDGWCYPISTSIVPAKLISIYLIAAKGWRRIPHNNLFDLVATSAKMVQSRLDSRKLTSDARTNGSNDSGF
jgi:hypothetical protein